MECSICGMPGASKCLAVDEFGNPVGGWVHVTCAPRSDFGRETQSFRGISTYGIPAKTKATVRRMWGKAGGIYLSVGGAVRKL